MPHHKADDVYQKKGIPTASERHEGLRAAWKVMVAGALDPRRLVFVDECGVHTSLAARYGYCPKGERLSLSVPRNRGKHTTLLSSMTAGEWGLQWR
jgi:hypothetical protein